MKKRYITLLSLSAIPVMFFPVLLSYTIIEGGRFLQYWLSAFFPLLIVLVYGLFWLVLHKRNSSFSEARKYGITVFFGLFILFNVGLWWGELINPVKASAIWTQKLVKVEDSVLKFSPHEKLNLMTVLAFIYESKRHDSDHLPARVVIGGPGGNNIVADYLITQLKSGGVQEIEAGYERCQSACTVIWASFENRLMKEKATMGFHRSSNPVEEFSGDLLRWYEPAFTPEVIEMITQVPSDAMCHITKPGMISLGMLPGYESYKSVMVTEPLFRKHCRPKSG